MQEVEENLLKHFSSAKNMNTRKGECRQQKENNKETKEQNPIVSENKAQMLSSRINSRSNFVQFFLDFCYCFYITLLLSIFSLGKVSHKIATNLHCNVCKTRIKAIDENNGELGEKEKSIYDYQQNYLYS